MSLGRLASFLRDTRGGAALEFGLVAPILAGVLVLGFDSWSQIRRSSEMRQAIETSARYYQTGGETDAAAQAAGLAAWTTKPADGTFTVARECKCGTTVTTCTAYCSGTDLPATYVTLTATSNWQGAATSRTLTQRQVVRVR
jgi:Flp pilus assembly protein TadG